MNARRATLATTGTAAFVIALTMAWQHAPLFVWNASESVPVGLYAVRPSSVLTINELVVVQPSDMLADFLAAGEYLPKGLPLLKHIAALPGSRVCRSGLAVTVDGVLRAIAREQDHAGRMLPTWTGCRSIGEGEVFLLNPSHPSSLDGRYFGPLPSSSVVGEALPVWTRSRQ
jgi:conjugative transfer signal peptidase TraF